MQDSPLIISKIIKRRGFYVSFGNAAVLIDYENTRLRLENLSPSLGIDTDDFIPSLKSHLVREGVKEQAYYIYDDFESKFFKDNSGILARLSAQGVTPKFALSIKDSADMEMCLDAYELCLTGGIDTFVIVSSDKDMFPLIKRLKQRNKKVILVGLTFNSSNYLIKFVDKFIPIELIMNAPYDNNFVVKRDIIEAVKRFKDLYDWSRGKGKDLGKNFLLGKLKDKLFETNQGTKRIYDLLIANNIAQEYTYVYNGANETGVRFIESPDSKSILAGNAPSFP
jgi:uncharacterized LabA/DUF88 family protein